MLSEFFSHTMRRLRLAAMALTTGRADFNLDDAQMAGSSFCDADLSRATFFGADLDGARFSEEGVPLMQPLPDAPQRLLAVAVAALATPESLDMHTWHECETTHCIAGWAIHQAGELGRFLEERLGPIRAGQILLGDEAASYFFAGNFTARMFLRQVIERSLKPAD